MTHRDNERDRLFELLADDAAGALSETEQAELARLSAAHPDLADDAMHLAAAALDLALSEPPAETLPAALRDRVETHLLGLVDAEETAVVDDEPETVVLRPSLGERPCDLRDLRENATSNGAR